MVPAAKTKSPEMASISLTADLVRKLRILTTHRSTTIYKYVGALIAKQVEKDYRKAVSEMNETGTNGAA